MRKTVILLFGLFMVLTSFSAYAGDQSLKIGVLIPKSGIFAETGRVVEMGLQLAFDEIGNQLNGRKVELIIEDTEGKAATGLAKAKKLVESDKVELLIGTHSSSVALAVRDYVHERRFPLLIASGAITTQLSNAKKSPYVYRCSTVSAQYIVGLPTYLHDVLGYKTMVTMAPDYVYGRETLKVLKNEFAKAGGTVIQEMLLPFPTMDFAPFLAKINRKADVVLAEFAGADGVRLGKQYKEFGMWNKMPLVGSGIILDETLPSLGKAAVGIVGSMNYSYNLETPENKKFAEAFQNKFGERPGHVSPSAYEVGRAVILATEKLHGDLSNKEAFMDIISKTDFQGPRGRFHFEQETHSVINTVYIREVVENDNGITFNILKTISDVKPSDAMALMGE